MLLFVAAVVVVLGLSLQLVVDVAQAGVFGALFDSLGLVFVSRIAVAVVDTVAGLGLLADVAVGEAVVCVVHAVAELGLLAVVAVG